MKKILLILCLSVYLFSCKQKIKEEDKHIDVFGYIKGQLSSFDTVSHDLLLLAGSKSEYLDSSTINVSAAKEMIMIFMKGAPNLEEFQEDYSQTVFGDLTLGNITVSYDCKNQEGVFERIDVYANPENGDIVQVYLLKKGTPKKNEGKQQLLWTHNRSFLLTHSYFKEDGSDSVSIRKVEWH